MELHTIKKSGFVATLLRYQSHPFIQNCMPQRRHMSVSNHRQLDCLYSNFVSLTTTKVQVSTLLVLCGDSLPMTDKILSQRDSDTENISMSLRHHETYRFVTDIYDNASDKFNSESFET